MAADLDANWEVLGEPVQSAMRALGAQGVAGMENPYERLKELTRGRRITGDDLREFIAGLDAVPAAMAADLDANWEVLGEPVQSAMRALAAQGVPGMENPYERLKELTRGRRITGDDLREFVAGLGLPDDVAKRLSELTPQTYIGVAPQLVDHLDRRLD
jgi:adenylosuccinate lyase